MPYQDWMLENSASIVTASAAAGLNGKEQKQMNGLAWIAAQHKRLMAMPEGDAVKEFEKLNRKAQSALKSMFGEQVYSPEQRSLFGNAAHYAKQAFGGVTDVLVGYGEALQRPFRAVAILDDVESFGEAWKKAADGKRLFDADREEQVDNFYGPVVSKIAKRISMGDTIGDVIADLSTEEEFNAVEKLMKGDETFLNAIRDYDQSKISPGRSIAHMFGIDPTIGASSQGIEGKIFKGVSGTADLAATILGDPFTFIAAPVAAMRKAQFGLLQLMKAQEGSYSLAQKALLAKGTKVSWDAAFEKPYVRDTFNRAGELVKQASSAPKEFDRLQARVELQRISPFFDDNTVDQFIKFKVHDADAALGFMKNGDNVAKILNGRVGSEEKLLPTHGRRQAIRDNLRAFTFGVMRNEDATKLAKEFVESGGLDKLAQAQSAGEAVTLKGYKSLGQRAAKMFDQALIERSVYTGGEDNLKRSLKVKSGKTVYILARSIFDKPTADLISKSFLSASEAESRNIIKGLYLTIGDTYGLRATDDMRIAYDKITDNLFNAKFSEVSALTPEEAAIKGVAPGTNVNPALVNVDGVQREVGVAQYHLDHQMRLPSLVEIQKLHQQQDWRKYTIGARKKNQMVTDFWSAFNLLPRLGLRSVLDEGLFHYLTVPAAIAQHAVRGFQAGISSRILSSEKGLQDVGVVSRWILGKTMAKSATPEQLRKASVDRAFAGDLLEESLVKSALGAATFRGANGAKRAKWVGDMVRYGDRSHLRALSENMSKNFGTADTAAGVGLEAAADLSDSFRRAARAAHIELSGGAPGIITRGPENDQLFNINILHQLINRIDRNPEISHVVLKSLSKGRGATGAVEDLAKFLKTQKGQQIYAQFERSGLKTTTVESDAFDFYLHIRNVLTDDMGNLNEDLLKKLVRKDSNNRTYYSASHLDLADIEEVSSKLPTRIFGYSKRQEVYDDLPQALSRGIDKLFEISDRQIATLSREPAVISYTLHYRGQLEALENKKIQNLMASGWSKEDAERHASAWANEVASSMAMNRVLGFIDNPHVRSNLAFNARNIARYYRATEDFYRRAGRAMNPRSVIRLRLANEGLSHAGFIHEDENGEKYFTFPADEITYNVYAFFAGTIMGQEVRRPMPLALTGKIKMMTPSLDIESNIPTFSGPLMSFAWQTFKSVLPEEILPEAAKDTVSKGLFGKYADGQSFWNAITPGAAKRAYNAISALSGDMQNEQVASAFMKSLAYYAANGMAPKDDATISEREQFMYDVKVTARNVVFLRNFLGIFSPVSPGLSEIKDVDENILDVGGTSLKSEFRKLVSAEYKKGTADAWNTAVMKWTKINPGRLVYTVSETESDAVAPIKKTKEAVNWIQNNKEITSKFRQASVFLMPQLNSFDMEAYSFLKREGYVVRKDVDSYFEEILNVVAENEYYDIRNRYTQKAATATNQADIEEAKYLMQAESKRFLDSRPHLRRMFETRDGTTQLKKNVVADVRRMVTSSIVPDSETVRTLRKMVRHYDNVQSVLDSITSETDLAASDKARIKQDALVRLEQIAGTDPNAIAFYDTILKRLLD